MNRCECGSTEVASQGDIGGGVRYWCRPCAMQVVGEAAFAAMHGTEWDSMTTSAIADAFESVESIKGTQANEFRFTIVRPDGTVRTRHALTLMA